MGCRDLSQRAALEALLTKRRQQGLLTPDGWHLLLDDLEQFLEAGLREKDAEIATLKERLAIALDLAVSNGS